VTSGSDIAYLRTAAIFISAPRLATTVVFGPNVRHERRLQAQLEDVRSMEGLGRSIELLMD
jgi:hypothetical protein